MEGRYGMSCKKLNASECESDLQCGWNVSNEGMRMRMRVVVMVYK